MTMVALLQDVVFARFSLLGAKPDLVLMAVVVWALLRGSEEGMIWAFVGGFVLDLLSGGPLGAMSLSLMVISILASRQWGSELGSVFVQLILLGLGLCFLYHFLLLLTLGWSGYTVDWAYGLSRIAGPSAILNALLIPFVYQPLAWLDRRSRPEGLTFDGT